MSYQSVQKQQSLSCSEYRHLVFFSSFIMRICYGRTCPVGGYVIQVCAEAATIETAVSLGSWVFFFFFFFFFFPQRHALQGFIF